MFEITDYAEEGLVVRLGTRAIAAIRQVEREHPPRRGWMIEGGDTLFKTPTGAVMAAIHGHLGENR